MSYLQHSTQLLQLQIEGLKLTGPGSLAACRNLQRLDLQYCKVDPGALDAFPWALVFPGPGQLPQLTSVHVTSADPPWEVADLEQLVACCSSLQTLRFLQKTTIPPSGKPAELQVLDNLSALRRDHENHHYLPLRVNRTALPLLGQLSATTECMVLFPEGLSARDLAATSNTYTPQQPQLEGSPHDERVIATVTLPSSTAAKLRERLGETLPGWLQIV